MLVFVYLTDCIDTLIFIYSSKRVKFNLAHRQFSGHQHQQQLKLKCGRLSILIKV